MSLRPMRFAMLLAALSVAWQPSLAQAAEEDVQLWLLGFARGNLAKDVFVVVDASLRLRERDIGPDQQTLRVTLEKGLANNRLRAGGGIAIFETNGRTEFRPHQQFRYVHGGWDLRTRFEQRMLAGAERTELRIRQRVQYSHEALEQVELIGSVEWFGIVQGRTRDREFDTTEQVRFVLAAALDVGGGFELQPGYLLSYFPRSIGADRINHIPQLTINYRF